MTDKAVLPKTFRRLWAASAVSALGDGAYLAALPLIAASMTHDPVVLSLVAAAARLPWLLFGLIGGALVDRWDRRRTMWIADLARSVLLVVAAVGAATGLIGIPLLIVLAFLLCLGQIMFDTATTAYLPELLDREPELLQRGNARLFATQTAANGFAGPPLGAALFSVGRTVPLVADAVSFLFSALVIRSLPKTPPRPVPRRRSVLAEAREGAAYLFRDPLLLGLSLRPAFGNLAFAAGEAVFVLFVKDELHLGPATYGMLLTAEAAGGLAGSAVARWLGDRLGRGVALTLAPALATCSQVALGLSNNAWTAGAAMVLCGASVGTMIVLASSIRQAVVPDHMMGRVASCARLMSMGSVPLGALLGGYLATTLGLRAPYLIGAGFLIVTTLLSATVTTNRRIDAALAKAAADRQEEAAETAAQAKTEAEVPESVGRPNDPQG
ncbi:MFS transporter [Streptomyces sp. NPDC021093]|uniref:MFS transporter n=1 Tax=Streptomyces sp. NPDC021093 TaxID=3365112 RepID=UPI00378AF3D7